MRVSSIPPVQYSLVVDTKVVHLYPCLYQPLIPPIRSHVLTPPFISRFSSGFLPHGHPLNDITVGNMFFMGKMGKSTNEMAIFCGFLYVYICLPCWVVRLSSQLHRWDGINPWSEGYGGLHCVPNWMMASGSPMTMETS